MSFALLLCVAPPALQCYLQEAIRLCFVLDRTLTKRVLITDRNFIHEMPNTMNYVRELYQTPGICESVNMYHIKCARTWFTACGLRH